MKFYSNLLFGALCTAFALPAVANVATTAGSNLTAYNGTGATNNNQWNSLMNGRAGMTAPEANFGNCNAVVLRCASPKCASGGCMDMNVATGIVAGCVNSNATCKQYGNDLIQYITAQVVAQSTAKVQQQQNAVEIARAQAEASAAAAEQSNAQMQQMQEQMVQMQQQMAESMNAMQEQMAAATESQNAQIQSALESHSSSEMSTGETGAVIAGLEGLGVAEQLAAKNGISTDVLVREQMGGQIETAIEDAMVEMKKLKTTLDSILEYAGCDSSANSCTGPKRVRKFKDMANEFFDPYEAVIENVYDALILAMTLGIDVSDVIMLLSNSCNIWGKYLCDTCAPKGGLSDWTDPTTKAHCVCNTQDPVTKQWTNCYFRVWTENGRVYDKQSHCRLVGTIGNKEEVWHEWIDANSGITGSTQVACASDVIDNISIFRGMRKKSSIDIDTLRDFVNQDSYSTCRVSQTGDFDVLEDCGAKFCNVDPKMDKVRYNQLFTAVSTKKIPKTNWCFADEKDLKKFEGGGSSNSETSPVVTVCGAYLTADTCPTSLGCKWVPTGIGILGGMCVDLRPAVCANYFKRDECNNDTACEWVSGVCQSKSINREPTEAELDADPSGALCRRWYSKDWCDEYYGVTKPPKTPPTSKAPCSSFTTINCPIGRCRVKNTSTKPGEIKLECVDGV